jgi:dihydrofolate reductase
MPRLRVHKFSVSLDGYAAGPAQSLSAPIGEGGSALHDWVFLTRSGLRMLGEEGGTEGVDDGFIVAGEDGIGATIMGATCSGPGAVRGRRANRGEGGGATTPPYHHPVFVLTHYGREAVEMDGGTTFWFTDDPIESVLTRAFEAAKGGDVRLGGGVGAVQQFLRAGLIDELHLAVVPVLLGRGERLFENLDCEPEGYKCAELVGSDAVTHVRLVRATSLSRSGTMG